ncbi:MAG: Do family serine endopeptidase [Verrucomicrobia bacterium]|nr:Do family serine endopeptidase [Verrucomicrobiota bacterium]
MISRQTPCLLVALLLATAAGFTSAAENAGTPKEPASTPKPALAIDATPVGDGKAPVLTSYADIVEPVQKAVVSVYATKIVHERVPASKLTKSPQGDPLPGRESKEKGLGSGVIISANGFILTNNHVIEGADELNVSLPDGREFKARVIGTDPKTDIAVVKIEADNLPTLTLADSDKLRVGDLVFAVGNPLGIGQTVTMGIVSAKGRNNLGLLGNVNGYENFIQTDAAINLGNSGGALIDAKGRLVGINSAIVSTTHGNIGIGLAIPVNLAASIMHSLIETGSVNRGYLGISVDPLSAENAENLGLKKDAKAVVITAVTPGSPAEIAGLKLTDAILSIEGKPVTSVQDLRLLVSQISPDTEISINLVREGKDKNIKARLGLLADNAKNELLPGVIITPLTDELRRRLNLREQIEGLLITSVERNSTYVERLTPNMVIIEINRQPVNDLNAARLLLQPGRNLLFVHNRGAYRYLAITRD